MVDIYPYKRRIEEVEWREYCEALSDFGFSFPTSWPATIYHYQDRPFNFVPKIGEGTGYYALHANHPVALLATILTDQFQDQPINLHHVLSIPQDIVLVNCGPVGKTLPLNEGEFEQLEKALGQ